MRYTPAATLQYPYLKLHQFVDTFHGREKVPFTRED